MGSALCGPGGSHAGVRGLRTQHVDDLRWRERLLIAERPRRHDLRPFPRRQQRLPRWQWVGDGELRGVRKLGGGGWQRRSAVRQWHLEGKHAIDTRGLPLLRRSRKQQHAAPSSKRTPRSAMHTQLNAPTHLCGHRPRGIEHAHLLQCVTVLRHGAHPLIERVEVVVDQRHEACRDQRGRAVKGRATARRYQHRAKPQPADVHAPTVDATRCSNSHGTRYSAT